MNKLVNQFYVFLQEDNSEFLEKNDNSARKILATKVSFDKKNFFVIPQKFHVIKDYHPEVANSSTLSSFTEFLNSSDNKNPQKPKYRNCKFKIFSNIKRKELTDVAKRYLKLDGEKLVFNWQNSVSMQIFNNFYLLY